MGEYSPYARNVVIALRLIKEASIATPTTFRVNDSQTSRAVSVPNSNVRVYPGFDPKYFLTKKEIPIITNLWKRLKRIEIEKSYLKYALDRFEKSFEDIFPEDIIVDCVIGLESIVFAKEKGSFGKTGDVIGLAISMLLGKNHKERITIKEKLKKAYSMRNAIVHGNSQKLDTYQKEILGIMLDTMIFLRKTLRKLIEEDTDA